MAPRIQPTVRRLQTIVLTLLLLTLPPAIGCMSMQTRRGIVEEQVRAHPEFESIMNVLHQQDGQYEAIQQQLERIQEQLRVLREAQDKGCKP